MNNEETYPIIVNEKIRDIQKQLLKEIQNQVPIKIVHSMLMFKLENDKCLIANLGDFECEDTLRKSS